MGGFGCALSRAAMQKSYSNLRFPLRCVCRSHGQPIWALARARAARRPQWHATPGAAAAAAPSPVCSADAASTLGGIVTDGLT